MNNKQSPVIARYMFVLVWIIIFFGLFIFFKHRDNPLGDVVSASQHEYTVRADPRGSYFIKGHINHYPVEFLVDTGASLVAIPQHIADTLGIKGSYPITLSTANGSMTGSLTRIELLNFGAFTLHDVKAVIIPERADDTVLLGMNVLNHFILHQSKQQLTLTIAE